MARDLLVALGVRSGYDSDMQGQRAPIRFDRHSLTTQMLVSFAALALLTAVVAGLPGVWLIRRQLRAQAWAQVAQGSRAALALYEARQEAMTSLAAVTAERPTLRALLEQDDAVGLTSYLRTLEGSAGVDLLLVCDAADEPIAQAGAETDPVVEARTLCGATAPANFVTALGQPGSETQAWLLATEMIWNEGDSLQGKVIAGQWLDNEFADEMRSQTGLEHTVLVDDWPAASTLSGDSSQRQPLAGRQNGPLAGQHRFEQGENPYYASRFRLGGTTGTGGAQTGWPVEAEVVLGVADVVATEQQLVRLLAASILLVAALGSLLATFLARRIGRPLADLSRAATAFSNGDLSTPLVFEANVREVALLGQALEDAREDLQHTLEALRREKAWIDHLLGAIVEGIVTLDREGFITFFSHGAERITGWSRDQVVGLNCDQVFKAETSPQSFSDLIPPPGQRAKISVRLREQRHAVLAVTGARLLPPEGGDARVALVFRDISEEDAVHRLLSHFLANISHELRTPLSAVAASVELLRDQAPDLSPEELQELLTSLHLGVLDLHKLVDNLLETASIEAGRFQVYPRTSDLAQIIGEAVQTMQPLLDKRGQRIIVELPAPMPVVRADPRRTVQVLINLLSNASKYGPDDSQIEVRAAVFDHEARVMVLDQGPGIPAAYRKDLFRRFVPPDTGNEHSRVGFGLGLSVVKAVVEAHGGQVGVDDRPNGGSVFWFTLPIVDQDRVPFTGNRDLELA